jgi:hypothetical protein
MRSVTKTLKKEGKLLREFSLFDSYERVWEHSEARADGSVLLNNLRSDLDLDRINHKPATGFQGTGAA